MSSSAISKSTRKADKKSRGRDECESEKRFKQRRHLQKFLHRAWPRKSSATEQHPGYGDARKCPQCAVIRMRVHHKTVCAHGFDGPCFYCHDSKSEAIWRCLDCEINLCSTDVGHHLRTPVLSTHRIVVRKVANGSSSLGPHSGTGPASLFYKEWMLAGNMVVTCDEQEFLQQSCNGKECFARERHDINCECPRDACYCEPVELDYVIYMGDRRLEQAYHDEYRPKVICIQCEINRRHECINSMKRLKRAKRILRTQALQRDLKAKLIELNERFCQQLDQPLQYFPPTDVPDLTDTDDEGGPLEDDFNDIKPGVITCHHEPDRQPRNPPQLLPFNRPKIQADLENDPNFQYLSSPASDSESPSSDSDPDDINLRLERILAQASEYRDLDSPTESEPSKQTKSKRKRKSKSKGTQQKVSADNAPPENDSKGLQSSTGASSSVKPKTAQSTTEKASSNDSKESNPMKEYTTYNQIVADLLDIRGFNDRMNSLGQISSTQQAIEVKQKLIDLKSYASRQYCQALELIPESDTETRKELERMGTKQQEVVDTTLSDFTIHRNLVEGNTLSNLVAQQLHDKKDKDGRPYKKITVHKSNTPPVSLRVLNKTQRFTAGKQHARDHNTTKYKIKISQDAD